MHGELSEVSDGRVEELEEEEADVGGALSEAEVCVEAGLSECEAEGVEQEDGLQLHEDHVLDGVIQLPVTDLVSEYGYHLGHGGLSD